MTTETVVIARAGRPRWRNRALYALNAWVGLILLLVAWQVATTTARSAFFPTPLTILTNMQRMFLTGPPETLFLTPLVTVDIASTLWRLLAGFAIGSIIGILLGVILGLWRIAHELVNPVVEFFRAVPAAAVLPIFIVLFGGGDGMRVAFIAFVITWLMLINTASGVSSIHRTTLEVGTIFRIPPLKVLFGIILPGASAKIFAGFRITLTIALLVAVVSELVVATDGIGYQLLASLGSFKLIDMWSWMVLLALLGYALNTTLEAIERRILRSDYQARERAS